MNVGDTSIQTGLFLHKDTLIMPYYHDILQDAHLLTKYHLLAGIRAIDESLGKDYAKQHPELLSAYLLSSSAHYNGRIFEEQTNHLQETISSIRRSVEEVSGAISEVAGELCVARVEKAD